MESALRGGHHQLRWVATHLYYTCAHWLGSTDMMEFEHTLYVTLHARMSTIRHLEECNAFRHTWKDSVGVLALQV